MNKEDIRNFLESFAPKRERTIVIVDFGNVEKWKENLNWRVGIQELAKLVKRLSGRKFLRRFYYGADYGSNEDSIILTPWSKSILNRAKINDFEVVDKRVKYIHDNHNQYGFQKKCDLDVEIAIDLIQERDNYDTIFIFSGDGDLVRAIQYLRENYDKECFVFAARGHMGREVMDAKTSHIIKDILYADDFEYRLNMDRFRR